MADIPVSDEELALRRRARRRLVGAIALSLAAIVILPMLFDREPKPLGPDVDVQIPARDTPFVSSVGQDAASIAPPASTPPAVVAVAPAPSAAATPLAAEPTRAAPEVNPVTKATTKALTKTKADPEPKPVPTPESREVAKAEPKAEPVSHASAVENKDSEVKAYYLQLGMFEKKANAGKMVAKARAAGFKAHVSEDDRHARVRIGPIGDRAKAEQYAVQLKAKGIGSQLLSP